MGLRLKRRGKTGDKSRGSKGEQRRGGGGVRVEWEGRRGWGRRGDEPPREGGRGVVADSKSRLKKACYKCYKGYEHNRVSSKLGVKKWVPHGFQSFSNYGTLLYPTVLPLS